MTFPLRQTEVSGDWSSVNKNMLLIFRPPDVFQQQVSPVFLTEDEARHVRARRLNPGDAVQMADGLGLAVDAVLALDNGRRPRWFCEPDYGHPHRQISEERIVFCALPKGSRLELIAEKGTELGMTRLIPVEFERSVRESIPEERLHRLAEQAAGQSRRFRLPVFESPLSFEELLHRITPGSRGEDSGIQFLLLEKTGQNPLSLIAERASRLSVTTSAMGTPARPEPQSFSCAIIVGPEGGLTDAEIVSLKEAGARSLRISDGILRIETAVLAGLTLVQILQSNRAD